VEAIAGVFEEAARGPVLPEERQRKAQRAGSCKGVGVVGAEGAAAAIKGGLKEPAGRLKVIQ
jgi:hypothetical protein